MQARTELRACPNVRAGSTITDQITVTSNKSIVIYSDLTIRQLQDIRKNMQRKVRDGILCKLWSMYCYSHNAISDAYLAEGLFAIQEQMS